MTVINTKQVYDVSAVDRPFPGKNKRARKKKKKEKEVWLTISTLESGLTVLQENSCPYFLGTGQLVKDPSSLTVCDNVAKEKLRQKKKWQTVLDIFSSRCWWLLDEELSCLSFVYWGTPMCLSSCCCGLYFFSPTAKVFSFLYLCVRVLRDRFAYIFQAVLSSVPSKECISVTLL